MFPIIFLFCSGSVTPESFERNNWDALTNLISISKDLKVFCPGIRGQKDKTHDQKRVMSYADFTKIADSKCFAVIGRPIIEGDPVQNIKKIIQSTY